MVATGGSWELCYYVEWNVPFELDDKHENEWRKSGSTI